MRGVLLAAALAMVLVTAGCAGPFGGVPGTSTSATTGTATPTPVTAGTGTPAGNGTTASARAGTTPPMKAGTTVPAKGETPSPTPEPGVEVRGGTLRADADAVFERVSATTGTDVSPPTVYVRDVPAGTRGTAIQRMLGIERVTFPEGRTTAFTRYGGSIRLDPGGDPVTVERTLAHEYVHVVQFRSEMVQPRRAYDARLTTDFVQTWFLLVEGGAVYVTDAYVRRYMNDARLQSAAFAELYADPPTPGSRLVLARYHLGYRYVAREVDDPANLAEAYEPFPETTEQVLHRRKPAEEPPANLSVEARTDDPWNQLGRSDQAGELFVRVLLRTQLDRERDVRAAAGWGNDRWLAFASQTAGADGLAWVLRWDSPAEADEFEPALRAFAEHRGANASAGFRVERVDAGTVVLFAGEQPFLNAANATADGDGVTVTVGDSDSD